MGIGAVIVAAGLSSRMGSFKPMLKIGPISVAQHVVAAFRQAGVTKIAVVTGHNAEKLEQHLAGQDVVFLRNEHYRTTQMFDSAKIGLSYMRDRCDRVLFTPVDVPLITSRTVETLLASGAELACPVCGGKRGHPLMLSASVIGAILKDAGEGGLKGALSRLATPLTCVEVADPGVLYDADTPEEFERLLDYHKSRTHAACPSDDEIAGMFAEMGTPEEVRAHGDAVAERAAALAAQVSVPVDLGLLRAACKLHDMARVKGKEHAVLASEFLRDKAYPILAEIVAQHHDLAQDARIEAELLYLADKLVKGTENVALCERFARSKEKCRTPEAMEIWQRRYRDARQIAERYQLDLGSGME